MASKRAAVSLARASAPCPRTATATRIRAAAQLTSRQYHNHTRRQPAQLLRQSPASTLPLLSKATGIWTPAPRRYSTEGEAKAHKIWDFEAIQKLSSTPNPSVTIIDVREPHELKESGRIPGALNIPVTSLPDSFHITDEEFEDRFGYPRPARDAEVVFYCRAGVRSRAAAGLASDAGWTKVGEYPGSWLDWFEKGGKVER